MASVMSGDESMPTLDRVMSGKVWCHTIILLKLVPDLATRRPGPRIEGACGHIQPPVLFVSRNQCRMAQLHAPTTTNTRTAHISHLEPPKLRLVVSGNEMQMRNLSCFTVVVDIFQPLLEFVAVVLHDDASGDGCVGVLNLVDLRPRVGKFQYRKAASTFP